MGVFSTLPQFLVAEGSWIGSGTSSMALKGAFVVKVKPKNVLIIRELPPVSHSEVPQG